jgi:uncharacterized protein (TIGR03663 family)
MVAAPDDTDDGDDAAADESAPAAGSTGDAAEAGDAPATDAGDASTTGSPSDAEPSPTPDAPLADYLGTGPERTVRLVLGVTLLAVLARLVLLGDRIQHFDEGRVAWWTLEFMRTSSFEYRYIIHGPFIQHLNTFLFALFGTTDFATRIVPALAGGLLPATALLFREHLRRSELVALALFLSFNPVLLYYSRFSRSTILVAAFSFVAFAFLVRAADARAAARGSDDRAALADGGTVAAARDRTVTGTLLSREATLPPVAYVHVAVFFVALAFAAKENAVVYVLCWFGASALVADRLLSTPDENGFDRVSAAFARILLRPGRYVGHALVALALFLVVTLFFYAPRGAAAPNGVGLYGVLGQPGQLPAIVDKTVLDIQQGMEYWFGGSTEPGCSKDTLLAGYACYLGRFAETLALYAAPLAGLSVVGFVAERYGAGRPRALVMFTGFWGFASVLGYPLGTDIYGSWITVNALIPLAVPAAVGLALIYRAGVDALREDDGISVALVAMLLLLAAGQVGYQGVTGVYVEPEEGPDALVQYAQPEGEWRPIVDEMNRIAPANSGDDVLFYGSYYVDGAESAVRTPACMKWFPGLPLPWYVEKAGMQVACANGTQALDARESMPPVVIARASERSTLDPYLGDDYTDRTTNIRQDAIRTVVYIREDAPRADLRAPSAAVGQRDADVVVDPRADRALLRARHGAG